MSRIATLLACGSTGLCCILGSPAQAEPQTTAFYYAGFPPPELTRVYDQVVVEPEHVPDPTAIVEAGAVPVAYLSIGEQSSTSASRDELHASWIRAHNDAWSSLVMDLEAPGFRAYLLEQRYERLWSAGYRRFFLDTLDSYLIGASTPEQRERQRRALISIVREMAARHPDVQLILNRGFEVLDDLLPVVHGLVAESLFDGWDARTKRYVRVSKTAREWLLTRLHEVRERHGLPVIVIDYRPPTEREEARITAGRIADFGFVPWVTDGALSTLGVGSVEVVPRRILILTNAASSEANAEPDALRYLAPVIEHLGYVPEHHALTAGLPAHALGGRYQGIVTWLQSDELPVGYGSWLLAQIQSGVRVAAFGSLGVALPSPEAAQLGVSLDQEAAGGRRGAVRVSHRDSLIGFEAEPEPTRLDAAPLRVSGRDVRAHLELVDAAGRVATLIATTAWGGFAHSHFFALRGLHGERAWVLDPYLFLARALALPAIPSADVTTENGRRLAVITLRPAGLATRARARGRPLTSALIRERLLLPHRYPHSLDLQSDGELELSVEDRRLAQSLLELDNVRLASLEHGQTELRRYHSSITRVHATMSALNGSERVSLPLAGDVSYLPPGTSESYPYAQLLDTLERTDRPRRLTAVGVDYHAYTAASVGGMRTLERIYGWLASHELFPIYASEYAARVRGFRELVLARHLDGGFSFHGGRPLNTVRVPLELGLPDLAKSQGVAAVRTLAQGRYVSFLAAGPRRLLLAAAVRSGPHLVHANAEIHDFALRAVSRGRLELRLIVRGHVPLELMLAGLPPRARCVLHGVRKAASGTVDAHGELTLQLRARVVGSLRLFCVSFAEPTP